MNEMFRRLSARPLITAELLLASFFANLLALASPMFVVQVLNRYVAYGVDATLITLTAGVLTAIGLELGFRQARVMIAASELEERDQDRAVGAFGVIVTAKTEALEQIPPGQRREILQGLTTLETTYNAPNMMAIMDVPFAFIFVLALFLLHPVLGAIVLIFISVAVLFTVINQRTLQPVTQSLSQITGFGNSLVSTSNNAADTIRAFAGHDLMMKAWRTYVEQVQRLRQLVTRRQGMSQTFTQSLQAVMGVAIIGIGAILVVGGNLDVGTMIGANILAARGLGPVIKLANLSESMSKAQQALVKIRSLASLPLEEDAGSVLGEYSGTVELRDVAFAHPGSPSPLFEQLSLNLPAGSVLLIRGRNGAGKSTLARLLVGLMQPSRGQILVDGVDLRQLSPKWWRRQVVYLPQEPTFLNGTIRSNLKAVNPELEDGDMNVILRRAGLGAFIDESPKGFETEIVDNGQTLAVGIRRRLALARAITTPGRLVVFDEPTEGVDPEGCAAVYEIMKTLVQDGRTIIVITSDPIILSGARLTLDLNSKPIPQIIQGTQPDQSSKTSSPTVEKNPERQA